MTPIWFDPSAMELDRLNAVGRDTMQDWLDIRFTEIGDDWLAATMPVDRRTVQPYRRLCGGASMALVEILASTAGMMVVDPARQAVAGMEINANHVRPVFSGHVRALAKAEHLGRTTQIWSTRITCPEGKLACLARFTVALYPAAGA